MIPPDDTTGDIAAMPAELVARLEAAGGMLLSPEPSRWGSYEILTPAGVENKRIWVSPGALASLLDEWATDGQAHGPRLAVVLARYATGDES
jgi:hypothetical protein